MAQRSLGRLYDVSVGFAPVDTQTGANTGKRVSLKHAGGVDFIFFKGAGTGSDDPVFTLQEHNASTGGTSQNLAKIDTIHVKAATTLAGTETWTKRTQAAAATYTATGDATKQAIYSIYVPATSLSDTFSYVSLSVADTGSAGAQIGAMLYLLTDPAIQRVPANLPASLA